jgi:DNA-binding transcriptional ArsR family regulator
MAEERSTTEEVAALFKALAHPLRIEIIDAFGAGPGSILSASKFANATGRGLSRVAYHIGQLRKAGVLEITRERKVRGATERSYSLSGANADAAVKLIAMARNGSDPARRY